MTVTIRLLSAVISSFIICFSLALLNHIPKSEQSPDVYYSTFIESFLIPFIYSTPIFLFVAFPYSLLIDKLLLSRLNINRYFREIFSMILFVFGGAATLVLFFAIIGGAIHRVNNIEFMISGGVFALVYFLVIRLIEYIWNLRMKSRGEYE